MRRSGPRVFATKSSASENDIGQMKAKSIIYKQITYDFDMRTL